MIEPALFVSIHVLLELALIARVMLRPHREPASRIAWVAVIAGLPILGMPAYLLFGEVRIGRRRVSRLHALMSNMPPLAPAADTDEANFAPDVPARHAHLFELGRSISGFGPVGGNSATLLADSNAAIDAMVADIEAAQEHVHLLFYIWLPDDNGCKVVEALKRAAGRGVQCRALVDGLGSRLMIHSSHWTAMRTAGIEVAVALPIGNPVLRSAVRRIDLRNHRKIVVIDDQITYCGSQNCADPEFRIKAAYAPWVDAMIRFEGPIVRQNQHLFACDWMSEGEPGVDDLLRRPIRAPRQGFAAQVIGTGPTVRHSAMPEMFRALIQAARHTLVISTPYYVPDEALQSALCSAAYRGVETTLILPAKNDSWVVAGASRSYYSELLAAGVTLYEYVGGLLHTKSLTLDDDVVLIGSANLDRRSFELNYENNILACDATLTADVRTRQQDYIARSRRVTGQDVEAWSIPRQLWNNLLATLGPIL